MPPAPRPGRSTPTPKPKVAPTPAAAPALAADAGAHARARPRRPRSPRPRRPTLAPDPGARRSPRPRRPRSPRPRRPRRADPGAHARPDPGARRVAPTPASSSVRVTSIPALLTALADNAVTDIVVANGTYRVSPASSQRSDSLWIGARFAGRTRAGHGPRGDPRRRDVRRRRRDLLRRPHVRRRRPRPDLGRLRVRQRPGRPRPASSCSAGTPGRAAPHHITLRNIKVLAELHRPATTGTTTPSTSRMPSAVRMTSSSTDLTVDGGAGALVCPPLLPLGQHQQERLEHHDPTSRRQRDRSTAILMWDSTLRNITIDGATITNAPLRRPRTSSRASGSPSPTSTSTGSADAASTARGEPIHPVSRSSTIRSAEARDPWTSCVSLVGDPGPEEGGRAPPAR